MNIKTSVPVTVFGLALLAGLAMAATTTAVPPPAPAGPASEFRVRMAEKLGLSAEQQKAIDDLHAKQRAGLQALKDSPDLTPEVRREKARAINENFHTQMQAVLTPEQQKKAAEWRGQARQRVREAGRHDQGLPPGRGDRREPAMPPAFRAPSNPLEIVAMGDRIKDRIAEKLQLTDEQRDKLEHLGRAHRAEQRAAAKKHLEEMRAVLTPEQQQKFEQWQKHSPRGPQGGRPPFVGMNDDPGEDLAGDPPPSDMES